MPRLCTVCSHRERDAIDRALIDGEPNQRIATAHGLTESAIRRHRDRHLARLLADYAPPRVAPKRNDEPTDAVVSSIATQAYAAGREQLDRIHAQDLMGQLTRQVERINLLSDATDAWLRDPEDPARYTIVPRGEDVVVIYREQIDDEGLSARKKARLSELIGRLEGAGLSIEATETRHADPRDLLLKTSEAVKGQMTLLLAVLEKLHSTQEVEAFQTAVLEAIGEAAPDVRQRIETALRQRRPLGGPPRPAQW
jgi:hypothetical protein